MISRFKITSKGFFDNHAGVVRVVKESGFFEIDDSILISSHGIQKSMDGCTVEMQELVTS